MWASGVVITLLCSLARLAWSSQVSPVCSGTRELMQGRDRPSAGTSCLRRTSQQHSGTSRSQFVQLSLILSFPSELHVELFALRQRFMGTVGSGESWGTYPREGGSQRLCCPSKAQGMNPCPTLRSSVLVRSTPGMFLSRPPRTLGLTLLPAKNCHRLLSSKPEPSFVYSRPSELGFLGAWLLFPIKVCEKGC